MRTVLFLLALFVVSCSGPGGQPLATSRVSVWANPERSDSIADARYNGEWFVGQGKYAVEAEIWLNATELPVYVAAVSGGKRYIRNRKLDVDITQDLTDRVPAGASILYRGAEKLVVGGLVTVPALGIVFMPLAP